MLKNGELITIITFIIFIIIIINYMIIFFVVVVVCGGSRQSFVPQLQRFGTDASRTIRRYRSNINTHTYQHEVHTICHIIHQQMPHTRPTRHRRCASNRHRVSRHKRFVCAANQSPAASLNKVTTIVTHLPTVMTDQQDKSSTFKINEK